MDIGSRSTTLALPEGDICVAGLCEVVCKDAQDSLCLSTSTRSRLGNVVCGVDVLQKLGSLVG